MKPVFVRVVVFDPITDEEFEVFDDIEVDIARILAYNPTVGFDVVKLKPDPLRRIFVSETRDYETSSSHYFRIGFKKANFSKSLQRLLTPAEATREAFPLLWPSRLPYWDSGWDDDYETNEFFDGDGPRFTSSPDNPQTIRIPLRAIYTIGHRGAPYHFPENTMASFRKALDLGANGLEFDLCLTKDKQIAVFHDPVPVKMPGELDRTLFEGFPYEFVSPLFTSDGRYAIIRELHNGEYRKVREIRLRSAHDLDIINLTLDEVRRYYKYHHVLGTEHGIPELDEFLAFASGETSRLHMLFFDVKHPAWDEDDDEEKFIRFAGLLGKKIRAFPDLPRKLVVTSASEKVLTYLKKGIAAAGETRCEYAYDAQGSFGAVFGFKKNPLSVARQMGNTVASIGTLFRPGNLDEISEVTRDRDYNRKSALTTVIHWTLNEPSQMYLSLTAGVNGIVTDRPDEMKKILGRIGLTVHAPTGFAPPPIAV